jgi:hypothetical protein
MMAHMLAERTRPNRLVDRFLEEDLDIAPAVDELRLAAAGS